MQALSAGSMHALSVDLQVWPCAGPHGADVFNEQRGDWPCAGLKFNVYSSITAERAGPEQAHFAGSGVGPGQAWRSTNAAAGASSSSALSPVNVAADGSSSSC